MTNGGDMVGDIVQGALLARAAEPSHGEGAEPCAGDGHTHEAACLNCGTALIGSHCHACGQHAHVHRTIGAFFHDLLHGVFHFEGKIWRTFPLLVWRPGKLTREYIDGRRASYVSPIALFLFVVFLSFAVFNSLGSPMRINNAVPVQVAGGMNDAEAEAVRTQADFEKQLAEARAGRGGDVARLEQEVAKSRQAVEVIRAARQGKLPDIIAASDSTTGTDRAAVDRINQIWRHARENPELIAYKLQTSAYKYAWLVIPLSVPFVWLLFPFSRRFHLYDHTVFVTYSVSFQLLLLALISVVMMADIGVLPGLLLAYAPFHMYRQAREAYGLSRFGAWWRTWFLSGFALLVLLLFALGVGFYATAG